VGWRGEVWRRVLTLWLTKSVGTTIGISAFFAGYFWVLQHPLGVMTVMPATRLDEWLGLTPAASQLLLLVHMGVYASLWVYVSLVPALLRHRNELVFYLVGVVALSLVGLVIFSLWPTQVPRYLADWSGHPTLTFMKGVDAGGNACPSLHVAFALYSALWLARVLREVAAPSGLRAFNWIWCLAIVYSTLSTRQHVLLDVLAGALLGWLVAWLQRCAEPWWAANLGSTRGGPRWQRWWLG
jgi:membrane-associated phospholipid phosphatase